MRMGRHGRRIDTSNAAFRTVPAAKTDMIVAEGAEALGAIPDRWRWHYRTLLAIRERLLKKRREQLADASRELELRSMHPADSATDEYDRDLALAEISADQDTLCEIEEALSRIRDNTYGVCQIKGGPIPAARLRALPWARFCEEAERALEKSQEVSRCHLGDLAALERE